MKQTKLDTQVTEYLLGRLESLLISAGELPKNWRQDLDLLSELICNEAHKTIQALGKPSLLKRAIVAGGGGLLAILNLLAPVQGLVLPPQVVTLSTSGGAWLISEAFRNHLESFFGTST